MKTSPGPLGAHFWICAGYAPSLFLTAGFLPLAACCVQGAYKILSCKPDMRRDMRRIYIYIYAISQGCCAGLCASNFSPESSFSRNSFVWRWVFQGFCMFYLHLCRLKSSLSLTWGQPAGLPGTRGYAPHMRQVFFF